MEVLVGDFLNGTEHCAESARVAREVGDKNVLSTALNNLGTSLLFEGNRDEAAEALREGLAIAHEIGAPLQTVYGLIGNAALAASDGELVRAARLLGASDMLAETIGIGSRDPLDQVMYERTIAVLRSELREDTFEAALAVGRTLDAEQAVREAVAARR